MKKIIQWSIENPTLVNLLTAGLVLLGLASIQMMPKDIFPEASLDMIFIRVVHRGSGPLEIENGIVVKIEEALQGISGISEIRSEARENIGSLRVELKRGTDTTKALNEIKNKIDQLKPSLPKDADPPSVFEVSHKTRVIMFALYGPVSRGALQKLAEKLKDKLLEKPSIDEVLISATKPREISVEVDEEKLRKYNLKISDISMILRASNFDLSGGILKTGREDLILRIYGKRYFASELEEIVIRPLPDGNVLRLKDVATVRETFSDVPQELYYNGKPAVLLTVRRTSQGNALQIGEEAYQFLEEIRPHLPKNIELTVFRDFNIPLRGRINLLLKNGFQGLLLVLLTLSVLMNLRLAFWVAAGLPIAILGTFLYINFFTDVTINVLSLFAFIMVLGVLVDDAIVIAENIYTHLERGKPPHRAALDGTLEVLPAVFAAVLTNILSFLPLFFMGGLMGKFIFALPAVVTISLAFSLLEATTILPSHLAHYLKPRTSVQYTHNKVRKILDAAFEKFKGIYAHHLKIYLNYRWAVLATSIGMLLISVALIKNGMIGFIFFPRIDGDQVVARFTMQPGTPREKTLEIAKKLEAIGIKAAEEFSKREGKKILLAHSIWLGKTSQRNLNFTPPSGDEVAEVQLELLPSEERNFSSFALADRWRKLSGIPPGVSQITFTTLGTPPLGKPLEFRLVSQKPQQLKLAAEKLRQALDSFAGVSDPQDDMVMGKRELRFKLKPLAYSLGITIQELALQLRYRISGLEVMRIQRGRDEIKIFVRYPESERKTIRQLDQIWLQTRTGLKVPLTELVTWETTRELKVIRRINRQRVVTVWANVDDSVADRQAIFNELREKVFPEIRKVAPEVKIIAAGQSKEKAKVFAGMKIAFPIALFAIFTTLVAIFRSYSQSLLVMAVIPFGLIGAALGHLLLGYQMNILSMFGIVGLSGITINDALVMVDTINRMIRNENKGVFEATWLAGQARLRPILSTTLTTFVGLVPLLSEKSLQAQFLIPMAISISFGVLFTTFVTLILVPALNLIINDIRRFSRWLRTGRWPTREEVEPAVRHRKKKFDL